MNARRLSRCAVVGAVRRRELVVVEEQPRQVGGVSQPVRAGHARHQSLGATASSFDDQDVERDDGHLSSLVLR